MGYSRGEFPGNHPLVGGRRVLFGSCRVIGNEFDGGCLYRLSRAFAAGREKYRAVAGTSEIPVQWKLAIDGLAFPLFPGIGCKRVFELGSVFGHKSSM
jgi:hypothetical protein